MDPINAMMAYSMGTILGKAPTGKIKGLGEL